MNRLFYIALLLPLLIGASPLTGPTDLGDEAYDAGRYEEALGHYGQAARDEPDRPEARYNLGNAYYKLGRYEDALREYSEAARLDPDMADAYYNAGDTLFKAGDYEGALKAFGEAKARYKDTDPDTEHNIEVTRARIEKRQEQQQKQQKGGGKQKSGGDKKPSGGSGGQQGGQAGAAPPRMSNEELQALLERQAMEERRLRGYFRPGKQEESDRERDLEQMLRGFGAGPLERGPRPGEPYVEKDW